MLGYLHLVELFALKLIFILRIIKAISMLYMIILLLLLIFSIITRASIIIIILIITFAIVVLILCIALPFLEHTVITTWDWLIEEWVFCCLCIMHWVELEYCDYFFCLTVPANAAMRIIHKWVSWVYLALIWQYI